MQTPSMAVPTGVSLSSSQKPQGTAQSSFGVSPDSSGSQWVPDSPTAATSVYYLCQEVICSNASPSTSTLSFLHALKLCRWPSGGSQLRKKDKENHDSRKVWLVIDLDMRRCQESPGKERGNTSSFVWQTAGYHWAGYVGASAETVASS